MFCYGIDVTLGSWTERTEDEDFLIFLDGFGLYSGLLLSFYLSFLATFDSLFNVNLFLLFFLFFLWNLFLIFWLNF